MVSHDSALLAQKLCNLIVFKWSLITALLSVGGTNSGEHVLLWSVATRQVSVQERRRRWCTVFITSGLIPVTGTRDGRGSMRCSQYMYRVNYGIGPKYVYTPTFVCSLSVLPGLGYNSRKTCNKSFHNSTPVSKQRQRKESWTLTNNDKCTANFYSHLLSLLVCSQKIRTP